jgi:hypothetical protein
MPVILDPDGYDMWLDPGMRDITAASELLKPYDAQFMRFYPISTRINHVANDGPRLDHHQGHHLFPPENPPSAELTDAGVSFRWVAALPSDVYGNN